MHSEGDFKGNTPRCYWGLPSISADDAAFPKQGYWRGFVWAPMAMLTYWGLQEYDSVPAAAQARVALTKQMNALMLSQWREHGHICENYSPRQDATQCTGQSFYHWGALTGFLSLLEAGFMNGTTATSKTDDDMMSAVPLGVTALLTVLFRAVHTRLFARNTCILFILLQKRVRIPCFIWWTDVCIVALRCRPPPIKF